MKKILFLGIWFAVVLLLVSASPVSAHHKGRVLAETTTSEDINFPPVTSGPGFILPDSPLFLIDQVFQSVRLTIAFDKEAKARVRAQIAGERLAELRVMLARNNPSGIDFALSQINEQTSAAASALTDASAQGKDVSILAKELNESIKLQRNVLGDLSDQTNGDLRLKIKATREGLRDAKIEVEDELPEDELDHEIEEALEDEVEAEVEEAEELSLKVEKLLVKLEDEASRSAKKTLKRREEVIRRAIEAQNEILQKIEEDARASEERKQEELDQTRKKAAEAARKATKEAQKATEELRKFQDKGSQIKRSPAEEETKSEDDDVQSSSGKSGSSKNSGRDDKE